MLTENLITYASLSSLLSYDQESCSQVFTFLTFSKFSHFRFSVFSDSVQMLGQVRLSKICVLNSSFLKVGVNFDAKRPVKA